MKIHLSKLLCFSLIVSILFSCDKDSEEIDTEKPVLTLNINGGFPQSCATLRKGETYMIKALATDNVGIASYGIDIHNNFDHHTHDDQPQVCTLSPIKAAIKPMIYMQNFSVSNAPKSYEINQEVTIPNDVDTGDYHCQISVLDQTGWQTRSAIDVKIIE